MDEIIYNALCGYYDLLEKLGYASWNKMQKLLVLIFLRDFVFEDYRGLISKEDYHIIDKALACLFGSDCLIPYPDYLKMGKLNLGAMTELAQRVKNIEDTNVLKMVHDLDSVDADIDSDVTVIYKDE